MDTDDHQLENSSYKIPARSGYHPTRGNTDPSQDRSPDLSSNWRTGENSSYKIPARSGYHPTRGNTDPSQDRSPDLSSNWRTGENSSYKIPARSGYHPTRGNTDPSQDRSPDLSSNWRTGGDHSHEDAEPTKEVTSYNLRKEYTPAQKTRGDDSTNWRNKKDEGDDEDDAIEAKAASPERHISTFSQRNRFGTLQNQIRRPPQYRNDTRKDNWDDEDDQIEARAASPARRISTFSQRRQFGTMQNQTRRPPQYRNDIRKNQLCNFYQQFVKIRKSTHMEKNLDIDQITEMAELEPSEIIMQLAAPGSGLKQLLSEKLIDSQLLESFLGILTKLIRCTVNRQNLIHLLSQFLGSTFLTQVLPSHILHYSTTQEDTFPLIDSILALINELVSIFPSRSFLEVTIVKTLLQKAVDDAETNGKTFSEETKQKLSTLHNFLQYVQDKKQEGMLKSDSYIYMVGTKGLKEEEDFRSLSIFPTYKDIYLDKNPVMRPNIITMSYSDATSYLETHFRLLREDFIRPLSDGISQLLKLNIEEQSNEKFNDIRVYFDVQIQSSICIQVGIVNKIHFNTKNLKHVAWQSSKRLLYGALVCLSKDNFENMLFATVADRCIDKLEKGIITVMFAEESRKMLVEQSVDDTFLMVETTAYFEAYRHVLEGLKEMVDCEIPLQNHIIHCDTTVCAPLYLLQKQTQYVLKHFNRKQNLSEQEIDNICFTKIGKSLEYENVSLPKNDSVSNLNFDVLDFNTWPTKEQLELDNSQFEAFKMSLTSELSLIQGPPGTGKTYVGLKIVHALLNNAEAWKEGKYPLLVVCYTNHALDQFLTGIYNSTHCKIVRVGSRSNSELMQRFNLRNKFACLPEHLREMREELQDETYTLKERINDMSASTQNAFKGIIHEDFLETHIRAEHFQSLISAERIKGKFEISKSMNENFDTLRINSPENELYFDSQRTSAMVQWLGLSALFDMPEERKGQQFSKTDKSSVSEEKKEEASIAVEEEPERAMFERIIDGVSDINRELKEVQQRAKLKQKQILAFVPTEDDLCDDKGPWQISKEMKKKLKNNIKNELQKKHYIDEVEYETITDLWELPFLKRWEIYRLWRSKFIKDKQLQIFTLKNQYQILINRLTELKNQEDFFILQKADVIGMTTTGAAKYRSLLQNIRPKIVVVEEAAEVLEAHIITSLSSNCQHLILIGDHQQLRPSTTVYELAKNFNLEVSMFERLIRMKIPYVRLDYQHRMRPEIARLLTPHIYDKLENDESVYKYEDVKGVGSNLYFVDHNHLEEHIQEGKSHQNSHEAAFVRSLCLYFIHQGYNPSEITILTTYSGQLHCLQKMMPKSKFEGVRICVVDKYQGEENEIIILSLVRSNLHGQVGFLQIPNRVCVALSRAKKGLFCIGNMQLLSKVPLWSKIYEVLKANGQIGKELKLYCQNHPNTVTYVSTSDNFDNVPEGGCMIPCEYRLNCGHVCILPCHPYDQDHKAFKCMKPCPKVLCTDGHKCKKVCSEQCGKCQEPVPKKIPICGHIQNIPCSVLPVKSLCREPCTKILKCGHECIKSCGEDCTYKCPTLITVKIKCGHTHQIKCYSKISIEKYRLRFMSEEKCEEKLTFCGHPCPGHLDESYQCCSPCVWNCEHESCTKLCWESCDRKACDEPCQKILPCGHLCIGLCGEHCPQKCKLCDADEVTEIYFGKEADPQARFVQLVDCPHFFEVTEFTKWITVEKENKKSKLKSCPKCSTTIKNSFRYGNLIKQITLDTTKKCFSFH